jgi:hypothetical protein
VITNTRALALAVACALVPRAAAGQQGSDTVPFLLTRMTLDLHVDYERHALGGTEVLYVRNIASHPAAEIPLLLNRLMSVSGVTDTTGTAIPFSQDVVLYQDDSMRQVDAVRVTVGRPVPAGDSIAIVVHYGGGLTGYSETGSLYVQDHVDHDFTIIREDALAFPALGVPSLGADRCRARGSFTFAARITVPADLVVAMGGRQLETTRRDSLATWSYRSDVPVPFLNIAIAPYQVLDHGGVRIYYFPQDSTGARMFDQAVAGAVARYAAWFGPLGQDLRLTIMEIPERWGSQADITAGIIETADAFRDRDQLYQVYHELSHLWNAPDLDTPSPRWNEGLASFLQWRMAAELDGWHRWGPLLDWIEQGLRRDCATEQPCATVPFADYGKAGLTDLSYGVGTFLFYSLYQTLGPDTFDRTYRDLFQRHRSGVTSAELIAAFRHASPKSQRILADWFSTTRWYTRLQAGESARQIIGAPPVVAQPPAPPRYLTTGLFIASIEEGARIFTPARLLPLDHPEALGHQFPTVLQLHGGEDQVLLAIGQAAGLRLAATLQRYPTEPDTLWPYAPFAPPPVAAIRAAPLITRAAADVDRFPVSFIVDTRGLSLADRHMRQPTTMGLDLSRAEFLDALTRAAQSAPPSGAAVIVYVR